MKVLSDGDVLLSSSSCSQPVQYAWPQADTLRFKHPTLRPDATNQTYKQRNWDAMRLLKVHAMKPSKNIVKHSPGCDLQYSNQYCRVASNESRRIWCLDRLSYCKRHDWAYWQGKSCRPQGSWDSINELLQCRIWGICMQLTVTRQSNQCLAFLDVPAWHQSLPLKLIPCDCNILDLSTICLDPAC